jgi:TPR repeat protein
MKTVENYGLKFLGQMYYLGGHGINQDLQKGIIFFKKAAYRGDIDGQMAVCACCYEAGKMDEAKRFFNMIEKNNCDLADEHKKWLEQIKLSFH